MQVIRADVERKWHGPEMQVIRAEEERKWPGPEMQVQLMDNRCPVGEQ